MPPKIFGLALLGAVIMGTLQVLIPSIDNIPWWLDLAICYLYYRMVMMPVINSYSGGNRKK